jgi:hypothetical protein
MYKTFKSGSKIILWCEKGKGLSEEDSFLPGSRKRRKTTNDEDFEEDSDDIFDELKSKNPAIETPKLRLWARLIKKKVDMRVTVSPQKSLL